MKVISHIKFDIFIFILSIFLQGFTIVKTSSFGIPFSVSILLYLVIKYKLITKAKHNKNFITINIIVIILILISYLLNEISIDILKVFRVEMLFISGYFSFKYFKLLEKYNYLETFFKYFYKATVFIGIYGIYQYLAYYFNLPLFMNIFRNNPSYNLNSLDLYFYYGGWSSNRIYTTFAEPSFYAEFVVILIIITFFYAKRYLGCIKAVFVQFILIVNLILTYSRSGIMEFVYIIFGYIIYITISKLRISILNFIIWLGISFVPLINIVALQFANKIIFDDLSSVSRTESVLYYLSKSFESIKHTLVGHGLGIMQKDLSYMYVSNNIEKYAHNGYVEIIYENGILIFIVMFLGILLLINQIKSNKYKILAFSVIVNTNDFGTGYNIESILILLVIMILVMESFDRERGINEVKTAKN